MTSLPPALKQIIQSTEPNMDSKISGMSSSISGVSSSVTTSSINSTTYPNEQSTEKEKIKVFAMLGPETSGIVTSYKEVDNVKIYKGFLWDVFKEIRELPQIQEKYEFDITFSEFGKNNYNQSIKDVQSGKYDIGLGSYIHTTEREKMINYTSPLAIDAIAVFHYQKTDLLDTFKEVFINVSYLIAILIALGIFSGLALFFINPNRVSNTRAKSKTEFFFRSIITGIATFFGEMGFLAENVTNNLKGIILAVIIMLIAFMYILFLQAEITSRIIQKKNTKGIDKNDIGDKPIIGHNGYAMAKKVEKQGATMEYQEKKTNEELFDMFKFDKDKYNGVALSYCDGYPYTKIIPNLYATLDFGYEPVSIVINQEKRILLDDINKGLLYLRSKGLLKKICVSYFGNIPNVPVCTLN